jgi:hypothetical protein
MEHNNQAVEALDMASQQAAAPVTLMAIKDIQVHQVAAVLAEPAV